MMMMIMVMMSWTHRLLEGGDLNSTLGLLSQNDGIPIYRSSSSLQTTRSPSIITITIITMMINDAIPLFTCGCQQGGWGHCTPTPHYHPPPCHYLLFR